MILFFNPRSDFEDIRAKAMLSPELEADIEIAAQRAEPVLITAPTPTAAWIARLIYLRAATCAGPFRVVDPADEETSFGDRLYRVLRESTASGAPGMLFIRDIARAGWAAQLELKRCLHDEWRSSRRAPRLVVSSSVPLARLVESGQFDRSLLVRLEALHISVAAPARRDSEDRSASCG